MSDISKIKLPNGDVYNLKDNDALHSNDAYVQDVQINDTSIVNNGVANIPLANTSTPGVITVGMGLGISNNKLVLTGATASEIKQGASGNKAVSTYRQHEAAFYGLAKAAGADEKTSSNAIGIYTDAAKGAIQHMIGIDSAIAPYEADTTADRSYAIGDTFMMSGKLYKVTAAIAQGGVITPDVNCTETTLDDNRVKDIQINNVSIINNRIANIPVASTTDFGIIKLGMLNNSIPSGIAIDTSGKLFIRQAYSNEIPAGSLQHPPITPSTQHISTFYGLAKAAGADMKNSSNTVGTYTDQAKVAIKTMLGISQNNSNNSIVEDIQINNSSILNNKIANIPYASGSDYGVISTSNLLGTAVSNVGKLYIFKADSNDIKAGTMQYRPIVPYNQHESVFYGLAKAAGDTTQSQSSNTIGTYTNEAKTAILNMLGINTISQPTLIDNNYIVNSYITEQAYTNGYISYMCNPFLTIAYINITTSAGLPANANVFFGKVGRYPKNKIITNVVGINNTVAQIIIDTDRKIYLYNASGTNSADTFSTIINIITTSNEVSSEQDTINGFPLLLDNAAYNNNVDTILGGTIENNDYAIIGPFDTGSSSSKALTFKTVPAGSNFNNTFIRYYSNLSAVSNVNYGITKPENTRTITASYRYFTATVLKSEIDNFFVHDDTNNVYICKGANVQ